MIAVAPSNGRLATTLNGSRGSGMPQRIAGPDLHAGEASAQPFGEHRVELDRNDARAGVTKGAAQHTGAGAYVEHEIAALDSRSANQLRCELATAEEVLAAAAM